MVKLISTHLIQHDTFTKHALNQVLITIMAFNPWVPDVEFVLLSCAKEVASCVSRHCQDSSPVK